MKKLTSALVSIACISSCSTIPQPINSIRSESVTTKDSQNTELKVRPEQADLSLSLDELMDEIQGSSNNQKLSNQKVSGKWQFGTYLLIPTNGQTQFKLAYNKASGDTVFAYLWSYKHSKGEFEIIQPGWHYDNRNPNNYSNTVQVPTQTDYLLVAFYSESGGYVNAELSTNQTSTDSKSAYFADAVRRSPIGMGSGGGIVKAASPGVWKQEFSNGAVLWREGQSKAYALPEPFWQAWRTSGEMVVYGVPTSDVTSGRTLNGKSSRYQTYEGNNSPSLHQSELGTYRFDKTTRDLWNQNNNFDKLGHPISHVENGTQRFEKGEIRKGQIVSSQNTNTTFGAGTRSADFQNAWQRLGRLDLSEISNGKANHLSPAEIIYYSAKENKINPVLLLAKLQDEQSLLTQGKNSGDFEWRLTRACGYGATDNGDIKTTNYYGFFPQLVSTSLQFEKNRISFNGSFQGAYESFTTGSGKHNGFVSNIYPPYAVKMNQIAGQSYASRPSDYGYFKDFRNISIDHIQRFLESYSGALKEKDLFQQKGLYSAKVKYP